MAYLNFTINTTQRSLELPLVNQADEPFRPSEYFVSNEVVEAIHFYIDFVINFIVSGIGVVSNIIIIIVFTKQGFKESMNISMTAISIWDLIKCVSGFLQRLTIPISWFSEAYAQSWANIMMSSATYLICFATYVSSVLAGYVAVERCICVTLPLMVKTILTPRVTIIAMVGLSIVVFGAFAALFAIYDIIWVYSPEFNETIAVYKFSQFYIKHNGPLMVYYNLSGVIWPSLSFFVIVICTLIIIVQLRKASAFRMKSKAVTGDGKEAVSTISDRDKQVVKMLVVIVGIYVFNLFPRMALYLAKLVIPEFYFLMKYHNLFIILVYTAFFFDMCNAAVNLFVFLTMSSNFKATFVEMFEKKKKLFK